MKRTLMQVYVKESDQAVALYQRAFSASMGLCSQRDDGMFDHAELDVYGQILAVAERDDQQKTTGNTMQFCLHFEADEQHLVKQAYDILSEGAEILHPLGPCDFSALMTDLIDKFGVRWCLFA